MKQVNRINQFLLKNYPLIWNTKLVWLMLAGLFFHLMFFALGYLSLNDPTSLQDYSVGDNFFSNGPVFLNMFISTILIVAWLFFMFKNNSFKSFYPTSKNQLFAQFVIYFIIIVFNISYFYSYFYGMKTSVKTNHPSLVVEKDIEISNHTAPFFSHHLDQYEINNKKHPAYLNDLYCETNSQLINFEKPHFSFLEEDYQFYTLKVVEKNVKRTNRNEIPPLFYEEINDSTYLYYFKDTVIDVSKDIPTSTPSYFNFSDVFYRKHYGNSYGYYYTDYSYNRQQKTDSLGAALAQAHYNLLSNNNSSEIKTLLGSFLDVADRYKIRTNLTTDEWYSLIKTDSFLIKNLIRNRKPNLNFKHGNNYQDWDRKQRNDDYNSNAFDENGNRIKTVRDEYISRLQTDYYLETNELRYVFSNINYINTENPFEDTIHFFMWFSFFLASIVFAFRTSGLRSLIFSILTVGILCVLLAMIAIFYQSFFQYSPSMDNFMAFFTWVLGTAILAIPIFYLKKTRKIISSICINISFTFFAAYIFLILGIITIFQDYYCKWKYETIELRRLHCHNILEDVGVYWSYIIFVIAFIFVYFFSEVIRKWRAMPETK